VAFIACSSPFFGDALSIMHSACQIGNARIWHRSRHGQPALVGGKLTYDASAFWRKLFVRRSNGKHEAGAINHLLFAAPAFFDFNTFNARVINGSMPFSMSDFLLVSLMSTGTPLPS
jgi:hypothetical protein